MKSQGRISDGSIGKGVHHSFLFSLRAVNPKASSKFDTAIDFTVGKDHSKLENPLEDQAIEGKSFGSRLPEFCTSGEWHIKGFYQSAYEPEFQKQSKEAFDHLMKTRATRALDEAIMCPRPASSYCHLCKENFSDYLKHVDHGIHKKKMIQLQSHKSSDETIENFKQMSSGKKVSRTTMLPKQFSNQPTKFRLVDQQNTLTPLRLTPPRSADQEQILRFEIPRKSRPSPNLLLIG